jgi:uncharacterized protein YegL
MSIPGTGKKFGRPLQMIWICDCSRSMVAEGKMEALNCAIKESIPELKQCADDNPFADVFIRTIKFSHGAEWINKDPIPLDNYTWQDLEVSSTDRDIGAALSMVAEELEIPPMTQRALPPVLILIADGPPTDNFENGLQKLLNQPWGRKAVRLGIKIGNYINDDFLQKFIGNSDVEPITPINANELVKYIRWV